jgi:hypothetical protein
MIGALLVPTSWREGAVRPGPAGRRGLEGCDGSMKLRLSSSGCETADSGGEVGEKGWALPPGSGGRIQPEGGIEDSVGSDPGKGFPLPGRRARGSAAGFGGRPAAEDEENEQEGEWSDRSLSHGDGIVRARSSEPRPPRRGSSWYPGTESRGRRHP